MHLRMGLVAVLCCPSLPEVVGQTQLHEKPQQQPASAQLADFLQAVACDLGEGVVEHAHDELVGESQADVKPVHQRLPNPLCYDLAASFSIRQVVPCPLDTLQSHLPGTVPPTMQDVCRRASSDPQGRIVGQGVDLLWGWHCVFA